MVKHNNVIPNQHFKKKWQFRVKTWFNQPARKERRRIGASPSTAAPHRANPVTSMSLSRSVVQTSFCIEAHRVRPLPRSSR